MAPARDTIELQLPASTSAPGRARQACEDIVAFGRVPADRARDLRLLVSELVTNSVRHVGRGSIRMRAELADDRVRFEVRDDGPGIDGTAQAAAPLGTSGRGLALVDRIADRWGAEAAGESCVWFELGFDPARN